MRTDARIPARFPRRDPPFMKKLFTTSETAGICGVAHATVLGWLTEGKLGARETPGGHRRIERDELLDFLKKSNMPVPAALGEARLRVLVVDDDEHMLSMIRKLFDGYPAELELHMATHGMAALMLLGKTPFDLVILDVTMPDMDGIEVCKALKRDPNTAAVRIIAITGKQLSGEQEEYLDRNVECVMRKPFSASALLERIGGIWPGPKPPGGTSPSPGSTSLKI